MKPCPCYMPKLEGHDYSCRQHPRFKRQRITDKQRLDWFEKHQGFTPHNDGQRSYIFHSKTPGTLRRAIDAAIRAERRSKKEDK